MFEEFPNLFAAFSAKKDGPMKSSPANRERFFNKLNIDKVVRAGLVHKNKVEVVSERDAGKIMHNTDGLITREDNLFLSITTADCLPVFIYNPSEDIIALVHGGWRSLASNILKNTVIETGKEVSVYIGPGISKCHFEVKEDVLLHFKPYLKDALKGSFLDLKKVAELQLRELGVEDIEIGPECTFCLKDKYFSRRRGDAGTMMAVLGKR